MSVEKFRKFYEQAATEAATDLPIVLAQYEQGANPEHAKVLRSLEAVLAADSGLDPVVREALEARAESMRPHLAWDRQIIAQMCAAVMSFPDLDHDIARTVQAKVLRSSGGGSRGRRAGTTTSKVEGAAERIRVTCDLCEYFDESYRSNSQSSPTSISNKIRTHLSDNHKINYTTKSLRPAVASVIMGERESMSLATPDGDSVLTISEIPAF